MQRLDHPRLEREAERVPHLVGRPRAEDERAVDVVEPERRGDPLRVVRRSSSRRAAGVPNEKKLHMQIDARDVVALELQHRVLRRGRRRSVPVTGLTITSPFGDVGAARLQPRQRAGRARRPSDRVVVGERLEQDAELALRLFSCLGGVDRRCRQPTARCGRRAGCRPTRRCWRTPRRPPSGTGTGTARSG